MRATPYLGPRSLIQPAMVCHLRFCMKLRRLGLPEATETESRHAAYQGTYPVWLLVFPSPGAVERVCFCRFPVHVFFFFYLPVCLAPELPRLYCSCSVPGFISRHEHILTDCVAIAVTRPAPCTSARWAQDRHGYWRAAGPPSNARSLNGTEGQASLASLLLHTDPLQRPRAFSTGAPCRMVSAHRVCTNTRGSILEVSPGDKLLEACVVSFDNLAAALVAFNLSGLRFLLC